MRIAWVFAWLGASDPCPRKSIGGTLGGGPTSRAWFVRKLVGKRPPRGPIWTKKALAPCHFAGARLCHGLHAKPSLH